MPRFVIILIKKVVDMQVIGIFAALYTSQPLVSILDNVEDYHTDFLKNSGPTEIISDFLDGVISFSPTAIIVDFVVLMQTKNARRNTFRICLVWCI